MEIISTVFSTSNVGVKGFIFWLPLCSYINCPISTKPLRKESFYAGNPAIKLRTLTRPTSYGGRNADEKKYMEVRAKINFAVFLYGQILERWGFNNLIGVIYLFFEFLGK